MGTLKEESGDIAGCYSCGATLYQYETYCQECYGALEQRISELEKEKNDLEYRVSDLESKVDDLEREVEDLEYERDR